MKNAIIAILIAIVACLTVGLISTKLELQEQLNKEPIVIEKVDSIILINDTIKVKINNLDSIKHEKIIQVISLDNDSTIKLFYELVSRKNGCNHPF